MSRADRQAAGERAKAAVLAALADADGWYAVCRAQQGGARYSVQVVKADGFWASIGTGLSAQRAWDDALRRVELHGVPHLRRLAGY